MCRAPRFAGVSLVTRLAAWLVVLAGASSAPLHAQAESPDRRALTLEDYYRLKSVGSPSISPDGGWVAYTVSLPLEVDNGTRVQTWVVPADGAGAPTRVVRGGEDVSRPDWGDDGRLRYVLRDTTWSVDPSRPDGPPVLEERPSPEGVRSPDGRWVARTRRLPAPDRPEPERTPFERRHLERFQGADFDWYPFRRDGQAFPLPEPALRPAAEIFVEPADGSGPPRQLTHLGLQPDDLSWTPDGRALVFTANEGALDEIAYGSTDLFRVTLEGELDRLTADAYSYTGAEFSPDGRWMAWGRSLGTDTIVGSRLDHGGSRDLYVQAVDGGEPVNLTVGWDLDAGSARWSPDSRHLYFTTGTRGGVHLFRVAPTGGPVEQVTTGDRRIGNLTFDRAFRRMAYTVGELDRPADVYVADIDGGNERRLTDVNRDLLAEVDLATRPAETLTWTSYDGTEVEGFLLFPHGYDPAAGPYPLIVMNHGGPHSASGYGFSFKNALFAAHGYFVFLPNFRSSTGYGDDFKWATWGGWGNRDGEDVMSGIDHLLATHPMDGERVGTTGHSYGGILSNWLITRYPDRFRAAVPGAGESNWTSNYALSDVSRTKEMEFFGAPWEPRTRDIMIRQSPALNCGGVQAATLFIHGEVDYRVPLEGSIQLYTCLKKQRVPTRLIIYEGQAHGIRGHWNAVHRMMSELGWWERYLKEGS